MHDCSVQLDVLFYVALDAALDVLLDRTQGKTHKRKADCEH